MRFDSSAETQHQIRHTLSLDPRMLRFSVVKLGHKLGRPGAMHGALEDIGGKVEWNDSSTTFRGLLAESGISRMAGLIGQR